MLSAHTWLEEALRTCPSHVHNQRERSWSSLVQKTAHIFNTQTRGPVSSSSSANTSSPLHQPPLYSHSSPYLRQWCNSSTFCQQQALSLRLQQPAAAEAQSATTEQSGHRAAATDLATHSAAIAMAVSHVSLNSERFTDGEHCSPGCRNGPYGSAVSATDRVTGAATQGVSQTPLRADAGIACQYDSTFELLDQDQSGNISLPEYLVWVAGYDPRSIVNSTQLGRWIKYFHS